LQNNKYLTWVKCWAEHECSTVALTACASPDGKGVCYTTNSICRRSVCKRLLAMDFFMDKVYKASNNAIVSRVYRG
jgi:hypothetical protein